MEKDQILQLAAVTVVVTAGVLVRIFGPQPTTVTPLTFTQKEANVAKEKTEALKALFETEAFKNGTSYDQKRLIDAIDHTYM